jgi:hypothetical protein
LPNQTPEQEKFAELLKTLIERKLISAPQAEIALADAEVTGMTIDEVLVARRWVSEETLAQLAPWLKGKDAPAAPAPASAPNRQMEETKTQAPNADMHSSDDFEENLRKYRELMDNILGEANK